MLRTPQAVGFYPGDLEAQVDGFLDGWQVPAEVPRRLVGGVVPHAGWRYSGRTAARTLHTLVIRSRPRTFVIFASVHVPGVTGPSVFASGVWETPVGTVEVDEPLARRLLERLPELEESSAAHDGDHAIEVQMPLLRILAPGARVVPVAMPLMSSATELGTALGEELANDPDVVVVASTDLTHYGEPYGFSPVGLGPSGEAWMKGNDGRIVDLVRRLSPEGVVPEATRHHNACGPGGLAVALASARARGAAEGHILEYTTSHEIAPEPGPFRFAVGYLGAVF